MQKNFHQAGQIGIAILLMMTVLMTMGLSVASRTTEDLFLSDQQSQSARVFNAAEAGIEDALSSNLDFEGDSSSGSVNTIDNTTIDYTISKQKTLETRVFEGVSIKIDVDNSGSSMGLLAPQNLSIKWSKETDCATQDPASIIVSVFYLDTTPDPDAVRARYYAYEGCAHFDDLGNPDGFTPSSLSSDEYYREVSVPLLVGDLFVRIKTVYNDAHLLVAGGDWMPIQSYNIRSQAKNNSGNETRIVEVSQSLDAAPSIMDYALFSGTTIIK